MRYLPVFRFSTGKIGYNDSSGGNCGYHNVLKHLNLTKENNLYFMARPVKHYNTTTKVRLQMLPYSILDVREIDQTFVPYVWIYMRWQNEHIRWNPEHFCGLVRVSVPIQVLWIPDITIEEMTEMDKAPPSPHLRVYHNGMVVRLNDMVLASTCKMQVYKFPFDIQSCNISFKSAIYHVMEIQLDHILNSSEIAEWSGELLRTQYEWLFISMNVTNKNVSTLGFEQSMIVYTITMKRRALLYIVNFMLPVLFFLGLDLSSFLISDRGGEKLSFKVTVLLAVTVLQLILNDILPSTSDKIPLIATYCIGSFGLMMLSLLETILVMHLMDKDSVSQDNKADRDQSLSEDCGDKRSNVNLHSCLRGEKKLTHCVSVCDVSAGETPSELLSVAKESSSSKLMEDSHDPEKLSDDLREMMKILIVLLNSRKEEGKPGYWTRVAKRINKVFFILCAKCGLSYYSSGSSDSTITFSVISSTTPGAPSPSVYERDVAFAFRELLNCWDSLATVSIEIAFSGYFCLELQSLAQ
ncbi:5-hydroxytryptamine receptor 3A-like [Micropterus salmoides]|uniref:5-hydroxytryptamine receptor 3A-like n=1 Tax=Micropterus salmoides TaxID=27706 RepID=UPI0018ED8CF5|nr:5-hydroxytryptamine receptor 3A-like [Micropterus salmoides]